MATEAEQLQRIEALSRELLSAAQADDWDRAFSLEAKRRPLMERLFSNLPESRRLEFQPRVAQILQIDRRVMELGKSHQELLGRALGELSRGKSAVRAYVSVG